MKSPLISVLIPVYNDEKYIKSSIESILSQTFQGFELIIVNDGSTDNTLNIIGKIIDPRIKIINLEKNYGIIYALNYGLSKCRGKYVARMDADDIALSSRLQTQLEYMENNPEVTVCGSNIQTINENGIVVSKPWWKSTTLPIEWSMIWGNVLPHPTIMIRSQNLPIPAYREFKYAEDYDLWLRLLSNGKISRLDEVLVYYRRHKNNNSAKDNMVSMVSAYKSNLLWIKKSLKLRIPIEHRWLSSFTQYGEDFGRISQNQARIWMKQVLSALIAKGLIRESSIGVIHKDIEKRLILATEKLRFQAKLSLLRQSFLEGNLIFCIQMLMQTARQYLHMIVR